MGSDNRVYAYPMYEAFTDFWQKEIVGEEVSLSDIEDLIEEDFEWWLVESVLRGARLVMERKGLGYLYDSSGIKDENDLPLWMKRSVGEIKRSRNPFEMTLSLLCSFPTMLEAHWSPNCLGGTLLALSLLRRQKASFHLCCPPNHVAVAVQLDDCSVLLVDVTNRICQKLDGNTIDIIPGIPALVVDPRVMDYRIFPLLPVRSLAEILLANLQEVQSLILGTGGESFFDREIIIEKSGRIRDFLKGHDLAPIINRLSKRASELERSSSIAEERQVVAAIREKARMEALAASGMG